MRTIVAFACDVAASSPTRTRSQYDAPGSGASKRRTSSTGVPVRRKKPSAPNTSAPTQARAMGAETTRRVTSSVLGSRRPCTSSSKLATAVRTFSLGVNVTPLARNTPCCTWATTPFTITLASEGSTRPTTTVALALRSSPSDGVVISIRSAAEAPRENTNTHPNAPNSSFLFMALAINFINFHKTMHPHGTPRLAPVVRDVHARLAPSVSPKTSPNVLVTLMMGYGTMKLMMPAFSAADRSDVTNESVKFIKSLARD